MSSLMRSPSLHPRHVEDETKGHGRSIEPMIWQNQVKQILELRDTQKISYALLFGLLPHLFVRKSSLSSIRSVFLP